MPATSPADIPPPRADPAVPALEVLLGPGAAELLEGIATTRGLRLGSSFACRQVRYRPGRSVVAEYTIEVTDGHARDRTIVTVAAGLDLPDGVAHGAIGDGDAPINWWWFPEDPLLPGLQIMHDPEARGRVLSQVGLPETDVTVRTRAYRATRRAVIEVRAGTHRLFVKVLDPERVSLVHDLHRRVHPLIATPRSHGVAPEAGIVVLGEVPGMTLRQAVVARDWCRPGAVDEVARSFRRIPADGLPTLTSSRDRLRSFRRLFEQIEPTGVDVVDHLIRSPLLDSDTLVPVHGDFHTGQIMIEPARGRVAGVVDLDTVGLADPLVDQASMLGQLAVLASQDARYRPLMDRLAARWVGSGSPERLAIWTAVHIVGMATGPFRAQEARWPEETVRRISLAERLVDRASFSAL